MNDFNGFDVRLLVDEDGEWIAHFIELPNISAGGATPEQAIRELRGLLGVWRKTAIGRTGKKSRLHL